MIVVGIAVAALLVWAVVATVETVRRDGYRAVPTRDELVPDREPRRRVVAP